MAKNELDGINFNEGQLEIHLLNIEEDKEISYVAAVLSNLKQAIKLESKKDSRIAGTENSFIKLRYIRNREDTIVYPVYSPETGLEVQIKGYKPIFNGRCSLVLCEHDDKKFIFFSPTNQDYESMLGSQRKINLAAVSTSPAVSLTPEEKDYALKIEKFQDSAGISTHWFKFPVPFYKTTFDIKGLKEKKGNYVMLRTSNPIDKASELELITTAEDFSNPKISQMETWFYFIGSVK